MLRDPVRPSTKKLFPTPYGFFTPTGREYVITRPDTPKPWSNVICPREYGTIVTQAGTGYSWMTHASLNRLTRWDQDLVRDEWGKFLYCRDRSRGTHWSLAWKPVQGKAARYECRHGIGYTTFASTHQGIRSRWTIFVPPEDPVEIWRVTLENTTRATRTLDLFSYLEWNLGPATDTHREFHKLFIEQRYVPGARALVATKRLNTIVERGPEADEKPRQPWNVEWPHVAFHGASVTPKSYETDKSEFIGRGGSLAHPAAMDRPKLTNTTGKWADGIASLQISVTLRPGASREVFFTVGIADSTAAAGRIARRYTTRAAVEKAWSATAQHWESLLAPLEVRTPDPAFDVLTNVWLKYQAMSGRVWGRTGYFQPGGAFGFRDQLQDSHVFLPLEPEHTLKQILLHAAHQFTDGTAYHWWHPLTEEGHKKPYNDDLLWLPFVMLNYLRETADLPALERSVPFLDPDGRVSSDTGTLYEHCRRAIDSMWTRIGPHGVPLMGAGDWNDGLSAIGLELRSESVWLAHFLVGILDDWVELERRRPVPDANAAARYARESDALRAAVNRHFWDGEWYARATKDSGEVIGSRANAEGKIFLNAQTWAILHRVVPEDRLPVLLRSLEKHLYRRYGPLLLSPGYTTPDPEIGYLTRYAPGARENGGLYTHAGVWAVQAECMLGRRRHAWSLLKRFWPVYRGMQPDLYEVEPYVVPGNVDGPQSPHFGRGGWTWYTGAAAWMFRIATEWILGVRPTWDGLSVAPCLPPEWKEFRMRRRFRGADYDIEAKVASGPLRVSVDGRDLDGNVLPVIAPGGRCSVVVRVPRA
jgi:cellobiose phosphorylase